MQKAPLESPQTDRSNAPTDDRSPLWNDKEYAVLDQLERGSIDRWLQRRSELLIGKSKATAIECEASKLSTMVVMVASAAMSASPFAWIPMMIGAGGYIFTIFQERHDTGGIHPIPLYRGSIGEMFGVFEGGGVKHDAVNDRIAYLHDSERHEYLFIGKYFRYISSVLAQVPPLVRFDLYRHVVDQAYINQVMLDEDEINDYVQLATSHERRTAIVSQQSDRVLPSAQPLYLPQLNQPVESMTPDAQPERSRVGRDTKLGAIPTQAVPSDSQVNQVLQDVESAVTESKASTRDSKDWGAELDRWLALNESIVSVRPNGRRGFEIRIARTLWTATNAGTEQEFNWGIQSWIARPGCNAGQGNFYFPARPSESLHVGTQEMIKLLPLETEIKSKLNALGRTNAKNFADGFGNRRKEAIEQLTKMIKAKEITVIGKEIALAQGTQK